MKSPIATPENLELTEIAIDRIIEMAWEDRTPFDAIKFQFGLAEADVKALLKTKENKQNESYVAIYINQSDILPLSSDKAPVDKLGKILLSLKDKTLNLDNISRFVHSTGVYKYERGRLIKTS